jgi:hypothetical protein
MIVVDSVFDILLLSYLIRLDGICLSIFHHIKDVKNYVTFIILKKNAS